MRNSDLASKGRNYSHVTKVDSEAEVNLMLTSAIEEESPAVKAKAVKEKTNLISSHDGDIKTKYKFKKKLGQGGFGTAYLVENF